MSDLRRDIITGRWVVMTSADGKSAQDFRCEIPYQNTPTDCAFCEGNESQAGSEITAIRDAGTAPNEPGWEVRAVPNHFPVLTIEENLKKQGCGIYDHISGFGAHEVIIDTPDHQKSIKDFTGEEAQKVFVMLQARMEDLFRDERIRSCFIVKNEGPDAGAKITHPHHQLIASPVISHPLKEHLQAAQTYYRSKERCIYCDILDEERRFAERVIHENDHFVALCPYASRYPFEIWILPKTHQPHFYNSRSEVYMLGETMRHCMARLARALGNPQYNYYVMTAPNPHSRKDNWATLNEDFHWHIEIAPVLTKNQGFDRLTDFHFNPTTPELAAAYLRDVSILV
jgi:UDPglucose--hexose-1-phosphate uridylyltransferase